MWRDELLGMLPKIYRDDPWLQTIMDAAGKTLDRLEEQLHELHENRYFDGMTFALPVWERILDVIARKNSNDDDRRAALRGKWLTNKKADRELLQAIADSWLADAVTVGFDSGYITLTVNNSDFFPYWDGFLRTLGQTKPAHLPILPEIPVETQLYIGGTLVPYHQSANLPQYCPNYDTVQSRTDGVLYSAITTKLPPMEV